MSFLSSKTLVRIAVCIDESSGDRISDVPHDATPTDTSCCSNQTARSASAPDPYQDQAEQLVGGALTWIWLLAIRIILNRR